MYIANADVFPTLFAASGLGITNFFGRIAAMLAPMIVEASFDGGMWLFAVLSVLCCFVSLFIDPLKERKFTDLK